MPQIYGRGRRVGEKDGWRHARFVFLLGVLFAIWTLMKWAHSFTQIRPFCNLNIDGAHELKRA